MLILIRRQRDILEWPVLNQVPGEQRGDHCSNVFRGEEVPHYMAAVSGDSSSDPEIHLEVRNYL